MILYHIAQLKSRGVRKSSYHFIEMGEIYGQKKTLSTHSIKSQQKIG